MTRRIVCLTGASGSGKTTIASACAQPGLTVLHKDSIGVPSPQDMERLFGGPEAWQRHATMDWMHRIAAMAGDVLFEGQTRFAFLTTALAEAGLEADLILIDCSDAVRRARLTERGQPELADQSMMTWATFLRQEAETKGHLVLDTGKTPAEAAVALILDRFAKPLKPL